MTPFDSIPSRPSALLLLSLLLGGCADAARPRDDTVLRWGGDAEGGAPFVEADPAQPDQMRGFDVEIAEMIARGLGREPRFVQVGWATIPASVERGDAEVGMSGLEDSPELRARHSVTIPYFEFRVVLAVRAADAARFRTLDELAGRRVGTLGATQSYEILSAAALSNGLVPVSYDDDVHPYTDLVDGRVDAVLLDHVIAERSLAQLGDDAFVIQPEPVATGAYVALFARADSVLRDSADVVLRARMADGSLERTFRSWGVWDESQQAFFDRALTDGPSDSGVAREPSVREMLPTLARAAVITLVLSIFAMALAITLGALIAAGRVYGGPVTRALLTAYVEVMRGTPVLLQLFVIYYGLAGVVRLPALVAAMVGLALNYAAYESEIYRSALLAIPRVQLEAARTLGLSEFQSFRLVRAPQAFRLALAPMTNDFVALLKDSSLVSVITVVELTKATSIWAVNTGSWVVPGILCAAIYLALSLPLTHLARRLERQWS